MVSELPVQQEMILAGVTTPALSMIATEKAGSEKSVGYPDPPLNFTIVPAVEPYQRSAEPRLQLTVYAIALLSPSSFLILSW